MAICRGCGETIGWVKLTSGKMMPVDCEADEAHYLDLREHVLGPQVVLVTEDGVVLKGREVGSVVNGGTRVMGRESHFASCPEAMRFRRTGQVNK